MLDRIFTADFVIILFLFLMIKGNSYFGYMKILN